MIDVEESQINVLIPMAGRGARFAVDYSDCPKPLIIIDGQPMIYHAVKSLNIEGNYTFVVLKEHLVNFPQLEPLLLSLAKKVTVVVANDITEGPASTCLLASHLINTEVPLLIANCDQVISWNSENFLSYCRSGKKDGVIVTYSSSHPKNSFVKLDPYRRNVIEVKEKVPISDIATVGIYWWRQGKTFVHSSLSMIKQDDRCNGEFYVAPAYNQLLEMGNSSIFSYHVDDPNLIGTPEDLAKFLQKNVTVRTSSGY